MDKRDIALQQLCPAVAVPRFSSFEASTTPGERILLAANGVFVEVTRKWGRFVRRIAQMPLPVPYGELSESTDLHTPKLPRQLLAEFGSMAIQEPNVEIGASIIWNEATNAFVLKRSTTIDANASFLKYEPAALGPGDHLVIDCHSHSVHEAFFSPTDDADDKFSVKFAYVVGNCDTNEPTVAMRLCLKGLFEEFNLPASQLSEQEIQ